MTERNFPLGTILTVTTGRLLCPIEQLYEILNYMTDDNLMTHQLLRASDECEGPLLEQHPQLADIVVPKSLRDEQSCLAWLITQYIKFGTELPVQPLNSVDHTYIDPLVELSQMTDKPIIVIAKD